MVKLIKNILKNILTSKNIKGVMENGTRRIYFKAPKNKSYRVISIDDKIVELLKREQVRVEENKKEGAVK